MGDLTRGATLRIMAGEPEGKDTNLIGLIIYKKRLPERVSIEDVRKAFLLEIVKMAKDSPYSYWIAPKPSDWLK